MSKRHGKDRNEGETRLFLEKAPSAENQGEFDEIVPEFMHRAFYRSTEDEIQTVEPGERLRAVRALPQSRPLRRQVTLPPLPPMSPPEAPEPLPALQPLRSHSGQVASEQVTVPSASLEEEETSSRPPEALRQPTVLPRPVKTSSLNLPLVACLLFVVGLLLWREQTRPAFEVEAALPLPPAVTVSEESSTAPALDKEAPYPGMTDSQGQEVAPAEGPEQPLEEPVEQNDAVLSEAEQGAAALAPAEAGEGEPSLFPAQGASDRAAILNRVDEGLSTTDESLSLPQPEAPPSQVQAAPAASSLFPATTPSRPAKPAPAPVESRPVVPSQPAAAASNTSLFPTAPPRPSVPEPPKPLQVSPQPPKLPQGEPYQIAEPSL